MQKSLIVLIVGLMVVGCGGKSDIERLEEENRRLKAQLENDKLKADLEPKPKPVKPKPNRVKPKPTPTRNLTLEEKDIIGTYEYKRGTDTYRHVFLDNGIGEYYKNGKNQNKDSKWSLVENEIHIEYPNDNVNFWKVNPDNSITQIANIYNGKRTDYTKKNQLTWKKINLTLEEKKLVGTYEQKAGGITQRMVLLDNGIMEYYFSGMKEGEDYKWSIVDNEIHMEYYTDIEVAVYKIEVNGDLTFIATIDYGKRYDPPKERQRTYKKIK